MMVALGAAVAGAVGYGIGSALQACAAQRASATAVPRHPLYLLGVGFDLLAFVASLVAIRHLPLFAVQSILAGSLAVTVVLTRIVLGTPVRTRDSTAIVVVIGALVVLALSAGTQSVQAPPPWTTLAVVLTVAVATIALVARYRGGGPLSLALIAGTCFAGSAVSVRALPLDGHWLALIGQPLAWAVVAFGVIGSFAYARSLEHGSAGLSTATLWVTEVIVAGAVGITMLGDRVHPGWALPALGAVAAALSSCVLLAGWQPTPPTHDAREARAPRSEPVHHQA